MRMADVMREMKFIPLIGGGRQPIQTLAMSDLCRIIGQSYIKGITGSYILAERDPVLMKELYDLIAEKLGVDPGYIPIPVWLASMILGTLALVSIEPSFSKENLLGLKQLRTFETDSAARIFGVDLIGTAASVGKAIG
jgi:hypothetical protein